MRRIASATLFARDQKSRVDRRLQSKDAGDVALFELRNQVRGPVKNRLIDVRPEKEPNEGVLLSGPELGPCVQCPLSLSSSQPGAETCPLATKTAIAIDEQDVAWFAAPGADQGEMGSSSAALQP